MAPSCWSCGSPQVRDSLFCSACGQSMWPPDALPSGGQLAGRYEIVGLLGRGGFGITYQARHLTLGSQFAIKEFFPPGCLRAVDRVRPPTTLRPSEFAETQERFLDEGRTLARYDHPGIVRVQDVLEQNGTTYLVMELLHGETLQQIIDASGPLDDEQTVELIRSVSESLGVLHNDGVLHRDIKPSNIIWHPTRGPVLIDFGSARQVIDTHTRAATALVSNGYAPPEQYHTRGVFGPPTDIYSLCATAAYARTGEPPQPATERMFGEDLYSSVPGSTALDAAILYGLELRAADRPQSTEELIGLVSPDTWDSPTTTNRERNQFVGTSLDPGNRQSLSFPKTGGSSPSVPRSVKDTPSAAQSGEDEPAESMPNLLWWITTISLTVLIVIVLVQKS